MFSGLQNDGKIRCPAGLSRCAADSSQYRRGFVISGLCQTLGEQGSGFGIVTQRAVYSLNQ